ncbi:MAG: preprotein translocase subunit YajC [Planctomycetota bacterium]|jgi:preprotein translocase YajC subunit
MNNIWILAQTEANQAPSVIIQEPVAREGEAVTVVSSGPNTLPAQKKTQKPLIPFWVLIPLMLVVVFMLFRGPQKQKQQRKQLVQSLKKNDRVQTIGGIITLKIDESNNTKITIVASAIGKNMSKD